MMHPDGQAGASANIQIPEGLTLEDLEDVEGDVLEWKDSTDYRAIDIVLKVYTRLAAAARARLQEFG